MHVTQSLTGLGLGARAGIAAGGGRKHCGKPNDFALTVKYNAILTEPCLLVHVSLQDIAGRYHIGLVALLSSFNLIRLRRQDGVPQPASPISQTRAVA